MYLRRAIVTIGFAILAGALMIGSPQPSAAQPSDEPPPYIYYYSDLHQAFVIERADGGHSRLLAAGIMPEDHDTVFSVEWSPSGEWVAWQSREFRGPGYSPNKAWILRTDGSERITLLDDAYDVDHLEWAPDRDWLLAAFLTDFPEWHTVIRVIDVPNNRILTELTYHRPPYIERDSYRFSLDWTEAGSAFYFIFERYLYIEFEPHVVTEIVLQTLDGVTKTWLFDDYNRLFDFNDGRLLHQAIRREEGKSFTDLVIDDLNTSTQTTFETFETGNDLSELDYNLHWNPDGSFALVEEMQCEEAPCSVRTSEVTLSILDRRTMERLALPALLVMDYCSHRSDWRRYWEYEECYGTHRPVWSLDGRFVVLRDGADQVVVLDVVSTEQNIILLDKVDRWNWLADGDLLLRTEEDHLLYRYDLATNALEQASEKGFSFWAYGGLDPNGRFIAVWDTDFVTVHDLQRDEVLTWPRHTGNSYQGPITGFQWHEGGEWFFSGGNMRWAGGGVPLSRAISIHDVNDPQHRELTLCNVVSTCTGFVPDRALPHLAPGQAESYTRTAVVTLLHENISVRGVAWSPDGTQIASVSGETYGDLSTLNIWDVSADEPVLFQQFAIDFPCPLVCNMRWDDADTVILPRKSLSERWDIQTGTSTRIEEPDTSGEYPVVRVSDDEQEFLIIDPTTETVLATLPKETPYHRMIRSGNQPSFVIIQQDGSHYFWDGELVHRFELQRDIVEHFDYDPSAGYLVTSNFAGRSELHNLRTGESTPLNFTAWAAVFSPDGRSLAAAGSQFVTIWDMSPYIDSTGE